LSFQPLDYLIHHGTDDLHALRAELVHGVRVGVPRRIVDVDQIDRRGAGANEGNVIVFLGDLPVALWLGKKILGRRAKPGRIVEGPGVRR